MSTDHAQRRLRGPRRPHPPRHPRQPGGRGADGRGARGAVRHLAARGLQAPAGPGGGGPDHAEQAGDGPASATCAPSRSERRPPGCGLPRVLGGELRPARRAGRAPQGRTAGGRTAGRRRGRTHRMTTTTATGLTVIAEPGTAPDHRRARAQRPARPRLPLLQRPELLAQWLGPRKPGDADRRTSTSAMAAPGATSRSSPDGDRVRVPRRVPRRPDPGPDRPDLRVRRLPRATSRWTRSSSRTSATGAR